MKSCAQGIISFVFLSCFNLSIINGQPQQEFTLFSSHIPYANKEEALSFRRENSSRLLLLEKGWRDESSGTNQIVDFPIVADQMTTLDKSSIRKYSKRIEIPAGWMKSKLFIHFSEVQQEYSLYINGKRLEEFSPVVGLPNEADITDLVNPLSTLYIELSIDSANFPTGISELFEEVYLYTTNGIHIEQINFKGYFDNDGPTLKVSTSKINYTGKVVKHSYFKIALYNEENVDLIKKRQSKADLRLGRDYQLDSLKPFEKRYKSFYAPIAGVSPWTAESPHIYRVVVELYDSSGTVMEAFSAHVGFKNLRIRKGNVLLNGVPIKLKGVQYNLTKEQRDNSYTRLEKEIIGLKRNNINSIKVSANAYSSDLFSLCDKYGLYVFIGIEVDPFVGESLIKNYYSLLQNHTSILGWYSTTIPDLKRKLDRVNYVYKFWKNYSVIDDYRETKSLSGIPQTVFEAELPYDTVLLKRILESSLSFPVVIEHTGPLENALKHNLGRVMQRVNGAFGTSGVLLCNISSGDSIPQQLHRLYQPFAFEVVNRTSNTYSVVNNYRFTNTDSITFYYRYFKNGVLISGGELPDVAIKPMSVIQVNVPRLQIQDDSKWTLEILARKKEDQGTLGEIDIASQRFNLN